eukprot:SAG31_NODE_39595_length_287_cov_0.792553_1_plen_66_part_01
MVCGVAWRRSAHKAAATALSVLEHRVTTWCCGELGRDGIRGGGGMGELWIGGLKELVELADCDVIG